MNALRRKELGKVIEILSSAYALIEEVLQDEQEAYDNIPESFQGTERYETMGEGICSLEDVLSNLEDIEDSILEVMHGY